MMIFLELPTLLALANVCEVLLHMTNGTYLLCRLVANQPDSFREGTTTQFLDDGQRLESLCILDFAVTALECFYLIYYWFRAEFGL